MQSFTMIMPKCTCCDEPADLVPRDDLGDGVAACEHTGYLYVPNGTSYVPALLHDFPPPLLLPTDLDFSLVTSRTKEWK